MSAWLARVVQSCLDKSSHLGCINLSHWIDARYEGQHHSPWLTGLEVECSNACTLSTWKKILLSWLFMKSILHVSWGPEGILAAIWANWHCAGSTGGLHCPYFDSYPLSHQERASGIVWYHLTCSRGYHTLLWMDCIHSHCTRAAPYTIHAHTRISTLAFKLTPCIASWHAQEVFFQLFDLQFCLIRLDHFLSFVPSRFQLERYTAACAWEKAEKSRGGKVLSGLYKLYFNFCLIQAN